MLVSDYFPNVEELRYSNLIAGNSSSEDHLLRVVVSGPKKKSFSQCVKEIAGY